MGSINSVNGNSNSNNNGNAAVKETLAEKQKAAREAAAVKAEKTDKVEISKRAKKLSRAERINRMREARKADKAEKTSRSDRAEKTHGTRHGRKVESSGRQSNATEKVKNRDNRLGMNRSGRTYDRNKLNAKTEKLSMVFKGLSKMGVSAKEVSKVVQKANRKMNGKLGNDLKQAYSDYKSKKISGDEFKSRLYEAATKKVQGIAFALKSVYSQKPESGTNDKGSMTPSSAKKADDNGSMTPSFAKKADDKGSELSFAKKDDAPANSAPRTSIFAKKENVKPAPAVKKDEPTLAEKAMAANKENRAEAKKAAKKEGPGDPGKTNVAQALKQSDNAIKTLEDSAKKAKTPEAAEALDKAGKELAEAREKADEILAKANEKADKILAKMDDDDDMTADEAREKVDQILAKGQEEAGKIMAEVGDDDDDDEGSGKVKEAVGVLANADKEAVEILDKGNETAVAILDEAGVKVPPGLAKKEEEVLPPGLEKKENNVELTKLEKELKKMLDDIIKAAEKLPPGLEKKDEVPGNADKAFEEVVGMFNDLDKMVNDLAEEVEDTEKSSSLGDFVSGLKEMFGSGNGVEGNSFLKNLHKVADEHGASAANAVGEATIKAETLSGLLKGGSTNSAFGINNVGDNGDGSGNFTAVNFMSDMSNNASEGLDSYKDAKEAREAAAENQAQQAGAEAKLSEVA